jgi:hypothetical protein
MGEIERAAPLEPVLGGELPDGPCSLGIAVFTADGTPLGAARCPFPPVWLWRGGRLCIAYGATRVVLRRRGVYAFGVICAIPATAEGTVVPVAPMWRISLGEPHELRAGDNISILDGVVAITPDSEPGAGVPL